jgi:hypothetical protein
MSRPTLAERHDPPRRPAHPYSLQGIANMPDHDHALSEEAWKAAGGPKAQPGWSSGAASLRRWELDARDALAAKLDTAPTEELPALADELRALERKISNEVRADVRAHVARPRLADGTVV